MSILGIVCALDWEADCLPTHNPAVRVVTSGMGALLAATAASQLVDAGVDALISFGSAGGLDPARRSGDILLPAALFTAEGQSIECDLDIRQALAARLGRQHAVVCADPLVHVDAVLGTSAEKAQLRERHAVHAPAAVDMESMAIARVAKAARLPFAVVRVVLDEASQGLPAELLGAVDARARPNPYRLTRALLRRPALAVDLCRLASARRRAATGLRMAGQALVGLVGDGV